MMPLRVIVLALGLLAAIPAQAATQNPGEAATAAAATMSLEFPRAGIGHVQVRDRSLHTGTLRPLQL